MLLSVYRSRSAFRSNGSYFHGVVPASDPPVCGHVREMHEALCVQSSLITRMLQQQDLKANPLLQLRSNDLVPRRSERVSLTGLTRYA